MRGLSSLDRYWGLVGTGTKMAAGRAVVERVASVSGNVQYGLFIPNEMMTGLSEAAGSLRQSRATAK
jgi:hypothetical protein